MKVIEETSPLILVSDDLCKIPGHPRPKTLPTCVQSWPRCILPAMTLEADKGGI